jgi:hypothetical protein
VRDKTEEFRLLTTELGMSSKGLATLLLHRALSRSKDKTVMLDYEKKPFLSEFNSDRTNVNVNADGV